MKVWFAPSSKEDSVVKIDGKLSEFQEMVGGYVEIFNIGEGLVVVLNEEGALQDLPYNRTLVTTRGEIDIVGDFVITRINKKGDFVSLSKSDIKCLEELFLS